MLETMLNGYPVEVGDLDAGWVLDLAAEAEVRERQAGRAKLRAAARWCVLHPATAETGFVTWSDTGLPGLGAEDEALGGDGTPLVAAFTPEPFAAALGVSTMSGLQLLADALDLPTGSRGSGRRWRRWWWRRGRPARSPRPPTPCPRPAPPMWTAVGGPGRVVWVAGDRDRGRPGHRQL